MRVTKKIRGGTFYKGFRLQMPARAGDYPILLPLGKKRGHAVSALTITPDGQEFGDQVSIQKVVGAELVSIIADRVYTLGTWNTINFDFPSAEAVGGEEMLRVVFHRFVDKPLNVYINVEVMC